MSTAHGGHTASIRALMCARTTPLSMCGNYSCMDGVVVQGSEHISPFAPLQATEAADTTLNLVSYELTLVRSPQRSRSRAPS